MPTLCALSRGGTRGVAAVVCNPGEMLISLADSARGTRPGTIAGRSAKRKLDSEETDLTCGSRVMVIVGITARYRYCPRGHVARPKPRDCPRPARRLIHRDANNAQRAHARVSLPASLLLLPMRPAGNLLSRVSTTGSGSRSDKSDAGEPRCARWREEPGRTRVSSRLTQDARVFP